MKQESNFKLMLRMSSLDISHYIRGHWLSLCHLHSLFCLFIDCTYRYTGTGFSHLCILYHNGSMCYLARYFALWRTSMQSLYCF